MKTKLSGVLLLCLAWSSLLFAQWDTYPTYQGYLGIMAKFQTDYPLLCKVYELGTSVQARKLLAVKISDNVTSDEAEPAALYLSTLHGDEAGGYVTTLHFIDYLLSNYGKDTLVTRLVDSIEIWIYPLANPDGTYKSGENTVNGAVRYNANGIDLNRDFPNINGTNPRPRQKETEAIINLGDAQNFILSVDFHGGAEGVLFPGWSQWDPHHTPDHVWFKTIQKMWLDSTGWSGIPDNDPYVYQVWTRMEHALYFQQCRDIAAEISIVKLVSGSQLIALWNKVKSAMLSYLEQTLYGIRGTITDSTTSEPLKAKIFIENHDTSYSYVYSHLPHGDYYRPIIQGDYSVTFSANGYLPKTVTGVKVTNNTATVLDVQLVKDPTGVIVSNTPAPEFAIRMNRGRVAISVSGVTSGDAHLHLFDMSGRLLQTLVPEAAAGKLVAHWDGSDASGKPVANGCYIIRVKSGNSLYARRFAFSRF